MNSVIIAGGGSAGSVLAARLSQNSARHVTLVEAGPAYRASDFPAEVKDATRLGAFTGADWGYLSTEGHLDHRIAVYRGKVLGGSSAVNGSVFIPPTVTDIQRWNDTGATSLTEAAYDNALQRAQVPVHTLSTSEMSPMQLRFLDSAGAIGLCRTQGFDSKRPEGYGPYPVNNIKGIRENVALSYLTDDVQSRPNLEIRGGAVVDRVIFSDVELIRATGVRLADGQELYADEVILAAGSYGSPAILLRSGVGPSKHLNKLGIAVRRDLPVGSGLQDHPFYYVAFGADAKKIGTPVPVIGAKVWTTSTQAAPGELDLHITATHLIDQTLSPSGAAFVLAVAVTRPKARGSLTLYSADPNEAPIIDLNFLGEETDRARLIEGIRLAHKIAGASPLADIITSYISPGPEASDQQLLEDAKRSLDTYHHPVATTPIGAPGSRYGVVDTYGAVHGIRALRVVDASIIPDAPSPATNAAVVGLAEIISQDIYHA
ncbi:GMC family oxidoreductase N-terminal domain-containing protein [Mycobacteroides chelonae]